MKKRGKKTKSNQRGRARPAARPGARATRSAKGRGHKAPARKATSGKAGGKTRRGGRAQDDRTLLADAAIAKATARAQASVRAELGSKSLVAEKMAEDALNEAQELGLLLEDPEEDEEEPTEGSEEENAYFIKAPPLGPPHARVRPAPGIESRKIPPLRVKPTRSRGARAGADRSAGAARAGSAQAGAAKAGRSEPRGARAAGPAAHLFPRNLKLTYPVAVRAEGVWIEDENGKRYLDGCSGAVVCSIGHGVEEIARVMTTQARRLAFTHSSQFITREAMELTRRIAALAPGDMKESGRVYLVSGGSEAVETAIKLARQYQIEAGRPSKHKIISRWQSYHGSTLGALAATGNVARREPYTPLIASTPHIAPCYCYRCPYGMEFPSCAIACVDDLESTITREGPDTVAAFMAEPVVGATLGAVPAVEGYWQRAREICDRHDVLLIADEVMTGVGRTGRNFAVDHFKVVPDIITTGKGLSAGYAPLGAVIARGFITDALAAGRGYFEHGFTYSANPLSAAVGNAVLAYVEKHGLIARAAKMGRTLGERLGTLMRHAMVGDVRGMGMMWGVELVKSRATKKPFAPALKVSRRVYDACIDEGLVIYPGSGTREGKDGDHFIIAPAFTITGKEIDTLVQRLDRALARVSSALPR
jgi:adenosylmethionine-8-amino-7-oxononanoate aminotransferase